MHTYWSKSLGTEMHVQCLNMHNYWVGDITGEAEPLPLPVLTQLLLS